MIHDDADSPRITSAQSVSKDYNFGDRALVLALLQWQDIRSHLQKCQFRQFRQRSWRPRISSHRLGTCTSPDDMQQMFGGGKPVYQNKNMVLIGTMGSGKTTLYNKLTNSNEKTSNGARTCTRKNASKKGLNIELQITDTPGLALDGGVSVDDSLEVRKALTVGDVTQIVVVQSLPNNGRVSALETSLAPIQKIMSCDTFRLDASGNDCWITRKERTPYRTRVFLVLTHRDKLPRSTSK